jgi:streptogramin lyase
MRHLRRTALVLTALLASCGGGASHSTPAARQVQTVSVAFHIQPTTPAARARRPKYVSIGTTNVSITVTSPGQPTASKIILCSSGGSPSCDGSIDAPVATDTFTVGLYDNFPPNAKLLSHGSITQNIVLEQANTVNITFDGVPAHTALVLEPPNPLIGSPSTTNVNVGAIDADGYTIIGPGVYDPPIQLTLTDPSGSTSLSKTMVTAPTDVVTLSYNGTPQISATVTSAVQGVAADQTAIFEPANVSSEFTIPNPDATPTDIVKGPDGALWFTEGSGSRIGRIDNTGFVTEYATTGAPSGIIVGPDNALWFSEVGTANQYGRIATTDAAVTEFAIAGGASTSAAGLAFGADGNLYIADNGGNPGVYAVTPATGALVKTFNSGTPSNAVVSGPDNNIWAGMTGSVTRIQLSDGSTSNFSTSGAVTSLAPGTDGNVWFTDRIGKVGKVTPTGAVTEYALPRFGKDVFKIVAATDGTYWFTYGFGGHAGGDPGTCRLGHSTAAGSITSFAIADCKTASLTFGPDKNLWLAEFTRRKIGIFSSFGDTSR